MQERAMMITLILPYPISANRYWAHRIVRPKGGKPMALTYITPEAKSYKQQVAWHCKAAGILEPIAGRVHIDIKLYPKRPLDWAKRAAKNPEGWDDDVMCLDLDNVNKVLLDSLKDVAIQDDKWVRKITAERMEPDGEARLVVTIRQLKLPAAQNQLFEEVA